MSYIIAQSGTHGTGKTTAALESAVDFKMANPDKRVGFLLNQEDFCPYPINQAATPESQLWMFTHFISQEMFLLNKFDVVIADHTIVDVVAHTRALGFQSLAYCMRDLMLSQLPHYHSITIRQLDSNSYCHDDGIRSIDPDFRIKVERFILQEYEEYESLNLRHDLTNGVLRYV